MEPLRQEAPEEPDESFWFRPPWEAEPADDMPGLVPMLRPDGSAGQVAAAADTAALLLPLAQASAALARLDARLACAAPDVAEGLRARLALREAAGWLAHQHGTWVHPTDLGLREAGLTGSVTAAAMSGHLRRALPSTAAAIADAGVEVADDADVAQALQVGRWWRRLAEHHTWSPLANADTLRTLLGQMDAREPEEADMAAWLARPREGAATPALLRAGQSAMAWAETDSGRGDRLSTASIFLAACLWRRHGTTPAVALPLWSAPPRRLDALALASGSAWLAGFLAALAEAADLAGRELIAIQEAGNRAAGLPGTARSHLPMATSLALRMPVLTATTLSDRLRISHQAATGLLRRMAGAGVVTEVTGRSAWRAFAAGSVARR